MSSNPVLRVFASLLLLVSATIVAEPRLLKDINVRPLPRDSLCGAPVAVNGTAYFCGANFELWMTDGTTDGTRAVRDVDGRIVHGPGRLVAAGPLIYVQSNDGLWRSDGTRAGTFLLRDGDSLSFNAELMTEVDDELFFFRSRTQLWKSDGSNAGTVLVYEFPRNVDFNDAVGLNGELILTNYEHEVWKSDGTTTGTRLLRDLEGINLSSDGNNLTNVSGVVYFSLETPTSSRDLWKTDGTSAGTQLVRAGVAGQYFRVDHFQDVAGVLFFTAQSNYTDAVIWRSDGTAAGTIPGVTLPNFSVLVSASLNGKYLLATPQDGLWASDGTAAGTVRLTVDFGPGSQSSLVVSNGLAYFSAENGTGLGAELWVTTGNPDGTRLVRDIHRQHYASRPGYFAAIDAGVIFQANRGRQFGGPSLWISDGSADGTRQLLDISDFTFGSYPSESVVAGNTIYFLADSFGNPSWRPSWSLWQSDGTRSGTVPLFDPMPGQVEVRQGFSNEFADFASFGGDLFVSAQDVTGWGLWRTVDGRGIEGATWRLPVMPVAPVTGLTEYNGALFFFSDTASGRGLWRLESGTGEATLVRDGLVGPRDMTVAQNRLVFTSNGDELWWSDGTVAGTRQIASLGLGADTRIDEVQNFKQGFVFKASWGFNQWGRTHTTALWISDGTAGGTWKIRRPYPSEVTVLNRGVLYSGGNTLWLHHGTREGLGVPIATVNSARRMTKLGKLVYFVGGGEGSLWVTDGTGIGTKELIPTAGIVSFGVLNGELYFTSGEFRNRGPALWKTDGTMAGTTIMQAGIGFFEPFDAVGNRFTAFVSRDIPQQIWETDGTMAGTRAISNFGSRVQFNPHRAEPADFLVGNTHLFIVDDATHGVEWWALDAQLPGGEIGDYVWLDTNEDGIQDSNEEGLADVAVMLENCAGQPIATEYSDIDGGYGFMNLPPGDYRVRFAVPAGFELSPQGRGGDFRLDSRPDPATGTTSCTTLAPDQKRRNIDAGFIAHAEAAVADRVWLDVDGNGLQDPHEPGIPGVEVRLGTCDGGMLRSAVTDAAGTFHFDSLMAGEYRLHYMAPAGYRFSPMNVGNDFRIDSNAQPHSGISSCRTIGDDQQRLRLDAGLQTEN